MTRSRALIRLSAALLVTAGVLHPAMVVRAAGTTPREAPAGPSPTPTVSSTVTVPPAASCPAAKSVCVQAVLKLINGDRAQYGLAPYRLQAAQSKGTAHCVGSYGHSIAMARSGLLWHINPQYPRASFPRDICISSRGAAENVGVAASGNEMADLIALNAMMLSEPHSRKACHAVINHACNILSAAFHQVGIGIYYADGATWLTEDFTG